MATLSVWVPDSIKPIQVLSCLILFCIGGGMPLHHTLGHWVRKEVIL